MICERTNKDCQVCHIYKDRQVCTSRGTNTTNDHNKVEGVLYVENITVKCTMEKKVE